METISASSSVWCFKDEFSDSNSIRRAEHAEVCQIHSEDVAEEIASLRGASAKPDRPDLKRIVGEIGQRESDQFTSAIHMGVASHAAVATGERAASSSMNLHSRQRVLRPCNSSSSFQIFSVQDCLNRCERNLVRAECAFDGNSIHFLGQSILGRAEDDHGQTAVS